MSNLAYNEYSETIRQYPENYLIAYRKDGRWIAECDLVVNYEFAWAAFATTFSFEGRYATADKFIELCNIYMEEGLCLTV